MKLMQKLENLKDFIPIQRVKLYQVLHGKPLWVDQPVTIQMDTSNFCNLECIYCNPKGTYIKEYGTLPMETIKFVLELFRNKFIMYVRPFMNGDPLLESRLSRITKMIKKILGCRVDIYTNGSLYRFRNRLYDSNLDEVRFTISAATPETYEKIHGRPLFSDVMKTLLWFTTNKFWWQRIYINYVLCQDNWDELEAWKQLFSGYRQNILALHEGVDQKQSKDAKGKKTFGEALKRATVPSNLTYSQDRPCPCFHALSINYRGEVMQCCDLPYSFNHGHVEEIGDIIEFWHKRVEAGLDVPGCRECNFKNPKWKEIFEKYCK